MWSDTRAAGRVAGGAEADRRRGEAAQGGGGEAAARVAPRERRRELRGPAGQAQEGESCKSRRKGGGAG